MTQPNPVVRSIVVPLTADAAFAAFTERLTDWWPRIFTFGEDNFDRAGFDAEVGGQWYEIDRDGKRTSWGDILTWNPPHQLAVTWQISPRRTPEPDAAHASLIEVRFEPYGPQETEVTVTHNRFENHGDGADTMREGMASEQGWSYLLGLFSQSLG
jgi:hypothetical protein